MSKKSRAFLGSGLVVTLMGRYPERGPGGERTFLLSQ